MTNLDRALRDFLAAVAKQADKLEHHATQAGIDKTSIDIISAITLALNKRSAAKTEPKQKRFFKPGCKESYFICPPKAVSTEEKKAIEATYLEKFGKAEPKQKKTRKRKEASTCLTQADRC